MAGNSFGTIFKITTFGESHGKLVGVIIDGCPANISLNEKDIQIDLDRRRPGQSKVTTSRQEEDKAEIVSGVFEGKTTGMPITVIVKNNDQRSQDYDRLRDNFRPGHADKTYQEKYGHRDHRGGGRSSGRETIGRVIASAVAKKILPNNLKIIGSTVQVGPHIVNEYKPETIEQNPMRCADPKVTQDMINYVTELKKQNNSTGALIQIEINNCPANLGEPVFDKLKADLAKAIMSIGAVTGFSYGAGFTTSQLTGQEYTKNPNNFGGMLGGISTGEKISLSVSVKPTSTIGEAAKEGRHDPCIAPRIIPVIEAMIAITLADHYLRNKIYQ
ncbi:chorismate synthase [Candidatus Peregrinibacteria bacterium CG11_big_fil_rev_8_21_14_0_20_41_10]|nr:MAG: chorismate synthase [Candidatus Peregrinibacteria bacterium CG11_big_fil_rev_8_21_14_0_20_41_10]PIZ73344.1 MAG: chorismate synthase [Candidatus Peregrinibacteria bacterium CG_4_10_14_0_2_um_filter_41_8]